jgi:hypothetical protein
MNLLTNTPLCRGEAVGTHGFILFLVFVAALSQLFALPVNAAETGIRGTVLWGPVTPGPARSGQSDEAPLSATFNVFSGESKVAQFRSDEQGKFELLLSAGDYTIVPDRGTPMPAAQSQVKPVTVPAEGFVEVTLRFDTGMR